MKRERVMTDSQVSVLTEAVSTPSDNGLNSYIEKNK